ncbi:MAG: phytanoyl-CoA dioxygenase family protein [Polyangiaceae bacterium]
MNLESVAAPSAPLLSGAPTLRAFASASIASRANARSLLVSPAFWASFGGAPAPSLPSPMLSLPSDTELASVRSHVAREGYGRVSSAVPLPIVERLAARVVALCERGWDASFALVFDEAWLIGRELIGLLRRAVNPNLVFAHEMWAFCVDATLAAGRARGVGAHRDRGRSGFDVVQGTRLPRHATAWLALTDADEHNGAMRVVPASVEGDSYFRGAPSLDETARSVTLEARPGDILLWSGQAVHWGGVYDRERARGPRIALAFAGTHREVARESPLAGFEIPMGESDPLPPLEVRLRLLKTMTEFLYPPLPDSPVRAVFDLLDEAPSRATTRSHSPSVSRRAAVDKAIAAGRDYLASKLESATGMFRDYQVASNGASQGSTEWISAFIAAHVGRLPECQQLARGVVQALGQRARSSGGWAYREGTLEDCDSTAWVLLAGVRSGQGLPDAIEARALAFVAGHQSEDGGFVTYGWQGKRVFGDMAPRRGWFESQPCVTAAALLALVEAGKHGASSAVVQSGLEYLRSAPRPLFDAYWWHGPFYATSLVVEALAATSELDAAPSSSGSSGLRGEIQRALSALQRSDGSFATELDPDQGQPFATALAAQSLMLLGDALGEREERAIDWLLAAQRSDGSFQPSAALKVPGGESEATMTLVDQGPFTTAAVLAALHKARVWL